LAHPAESTALSRSNGSLANRRAVELLKFQRTRGEAATGPDIVAALGFPGHQPAS